MRSVVLVSVLSRDMCRVLFIEFGLGGDMLQLPGLVNNIYFL